MEIYFYYTKAAQKDYFIKTGKVLPDKDRVEYDPLTLTSAQRELIYGNESIFPGDRRFDYPCNLDDMLAYLKIVHNKEIEQRNSKISEALNIIENLERQEPSEIVDLFLAQKVYTTQYFENRDYHKAREILLEYSDLPSVGTDIKERLLVLDKKDRDTSLTFDRKIEDREKQRIDREENIQQQKRLKQEQEQINRRDWIEQYGDERLKLTEANGYQCQPLYVVARAKHEFPEFILDFNNTWRYKGRVSPSLQALRKLGEYSESRIVWVTEAPASRWGDGGVEAMLIENFLGKYDLLLPIVEGQLDTVEDVEQEVD